MNRYAGHHAKMPGNPRLLMWARGTRFCLRLSDCQTVNASTAAEHQPASRSEKKSKFNITTVSSVSRF